MKSLITGILILVLLPLFTSCGGDGDGDGDGDSSEQSIAWITYSSAVTVDAEGAALAELSGAAFVSADYVRHKCIGLACIFDWFDNSYPGVDVIWTNLTTGAQGTASSRYGTATSWYHWWSASVPIIIGVINQLQVSATDPAGNVATANFSVEYFPVPNDLRANTDDSEVTLLWSPTPNASAYRLYWATTPGVAFSLGTPIDVTNPPYVHSGLVNGTTYYYVITSYYLTSESPPSAEIAATAGAPPQPTNLVAALAGSDVELSWDAVAAANTYTLYWANEPGVTKQTGSPISSAISPYLHTGLSGLPYYYIVTAVNGYGESLESEEVMAFPPFAPPVPTGLSVTQELNSFGDYLPHVDLVWQPVPGTYDYSVSRCWAWATYTGGDCEPASPPFACYGPWEYIGSLITDNQFVDRFVDPYAYWYYVTTRNAYGTSMPSDWAGLCVEP